MTLTYFSICHTVNGQLLICRVYPCSYMLKLVISVVFLCFWQYFNPALVVKYVFPVYTTRITCTLIQLLYHDMTNLSAIQNNNQNCFFLEAAFGYICPWWSPDLRWPWIKLSSAIWHQNSWSEYVQGSSGCTLIAAKSLLSSRKKSEWNINWYAELSVIKCFWKCCFGTHMS